jgi:hypothetical protein
MERLLKGRDPRGAAAGNLADAALGGLQLRLVIIQDARLIQPAERVIRIVERDGLFG